MKTNIKKKKEQILLKALDGDLERMTRSPWVRSIRDGKQFVCPYCNLSTQPCKCDPSAICYHALLDGTEGAIIQKSLKQLNTEEVGRCEICGAEIPLSYLKKHPTADVCPHCQKKAKKIKSKQTKK